MRIHLGIEIGPARRGAKMREGNKLKQSIMAHIYENKINGLAHTNFKINRLNNIHKHNT